jgi:transposase
MDGRRSSAASRQEPLQRQYRELGKRYDGLAKRYSEAMGLKQLHEKRAYILEADLRRLNPLLYRQDQHIERLRERIEKLQTQNHALREQLAGVREKMDVQSRPLPPFVKANVPAKAKKRPGRKAGHEAAHRPLPATIDHYVEVPPPVDAGGACGCPKCRTQLLWTKWHKRIVEDIEKPKPAVTCYHTLGGYCPSCREYVETRAPEQPPAADVPHGQLGINALAMAGMMRIVYRMPYALISQLMADLPGITISNGALAKQVTRMGKWLDKEYQRLRVFLRLAPAVHMDETSWRVDGNNRWLWTLLDARHTVFHVDKSRGQKVVKELLGEVFGGTLVTDFYTGYGAILCQKQKCLVHLLRELRDTAAKDPAFAKGSFHRRLKRLVKELLLLKKHKAELKAAEYQRSGGRLEERLRELSSRNWNEAHADRIAKRLRKHEKELTLFLWEEVDGTNNAAERALRPAVVMRKITGGSRSERGARATAVLMSVMRTARQQNLPIFDTIKRLLMTAWANQPAGLLTDTPADTS